MNTHHMQSIDETLNPEIVSGVENWMSTATPKGKNLIIIIIIIIHNFYSSKINYCV